MTAHNASNINLNEIETFPIIKGNAISFTDGLTQYLLPDFVSLSIKIDDKFVNKTLREIYDLNISPFISKGISKDIEFRITQELKDIELPWTSEDFFVVGDIIVKL